MNSLRYHNSYHSTLLVGALALVLATVVASAVLVQPYNYMLDDSAMVNQYDSSGSLSPFYNDQGGASEHNADRDVVGIIGEGLRVRLARMLDHNQNEQEDPSQGQLSQEMADMIQSEQQHSGKSLSSSMANILLNVAQAAVDQASASASDEHGQKEQEQHGSAAPAADVEQAMSSRGAGSSPILELDTTQSGAHGGSMPSKADLKVGPSQWFNPKETIPVLKISSMATPSKYKKVYFRSEKKLVDGAFHSPSGAQDEKKSLVKSFNSGVQRRSSRGTSAASPPGVFQDGVIDFLKKFRDVYVQTRPVGTPSSASASAASGLMAAAASAPWASFLAPASSSSGGSRPTLATALQAASSLVSSASQLSQAASPSSSSSASSGAASALAAGAAGAAASNSGKSPLTPQSYVSFWSKTFPTWVKKMLKQMRRRSLYNSSRRQQHQQHHSATGLGQKIASGAISGVMDSSSGSSSGSSSSSSSAAASSRT